MSKATTDTEIAAVRGAKTARDAAEVTLLQTVISWTAAHRVDNSLVDETTFGSNGVLLGGIGCPLVSEFDVYDLATSLGMGTEGGCGYVGKVLELRYRLPKTWEQVIALKVPVWKAFKVAESTMCLTFEAAGYVDRMLAPVLASCSFAQIERTITMSIDLYDPEEAERRRLKAGEGRCVDIHLGQHHGSTTGIVEVNGTLALTDTLDLEQAVRNGAKPLSELGCAETLDARRSMAVGEMARNQLALDLTGHGEPRGGRGVTIYAHIDPDTAHASLDNPGAGDVLMSPEHHAPPPR